MAACTAVTQPSRTRRTVVLLGVEQVAGCARTDGLEQMLLYENMNPVQAEFDTIKFNRARNGLAPEGVAVALGTFRLSGSVYMVGKGIPNVAPPWSKILRACGWKETRYVKDTAPTIALGEVTAIGAKTGGAMDTGTYKYKFALIPATATDGETKNAAMSQTPGAGAAADGGIVAGSPDVTVGSVVLDWSGCTPLKATGAKLRIYRTLAGGSTFYFLAEVAADTAPYQYTDTFNDSDLADPLPTDDVSKEYVVWLPQNTGHDSLTVLNYLDSRKYPATGVRGTIAFNGDAAQPFRGEFDLRGVYNDSTYGANPPGLSTPGFPPRLIKTTLSIAPAGGGTPYVPKVKRIGVALGANVTRRMDTNANEGLIEYGIYEEFSPRLTLQVEVDKTSGGIFGDPTKDWIEYMKAGQKFRVSFLVSTTGGSGDAGTRILIVAGDDPANGENQDLAGVGTQFGCQLITAPAFDDSEGQRVWNLEFELGQVDSGTDTDNLHFLKFIQY